MSIFDWFKRKKEANYWGAVAGAVAKVENVAPVKLAPADPGIPPIVAWFLDRLGWSEKTHDKILSKYWKYSGHPLWDTIRGASRAWCAMSLNGALHDCGFKGTGSAAAISFLRYGLPCEDKDGAILVIEHANGRHHVCVRWQGRCLGGNQHDQICIQDLSPGDKIIACRWPVRA